MQTKKRDIEQIRAYELSPDGPWVNAAVRRKESLVSSVKGYHKHTYYEINLILSGDARILTANENIEGKRGRLILSPPSAPHYVKHDGDTPFKRVYLMFTEEYVADGFSKWKELSEVFGDCGTSLFLSEEEISHYLDIVSRIEKEKEPLPIKMLIYYLLSVLATRPAKSSGRNGERVPAYVLSSMSYIEENLDRKISADSLAREFHIGRTTLMTGFKKHSGLTVGEYVDSRRLDRAVSLLKEGETVESAALRCGFSDSGGLNRLFKRYYGLSPLKYVRKINK